MSRKVFTQFFVLILFVLAFLGTPFQARAGGVCGGLFVVEQGQTLESIAATCGTTVAAIVAANPGIGGTVSTGQVLMVPGINFVASGTPVTATPTPIVTPTPVTVVNNTTYNNYYNYYNYYNNNGYNNAPVSYNGTYTVQVGDTLSGIASRFGVSIYDLWAANPYIMDINLLYVGQTIRVPSSSGVPGPVPTSTTSDNPSTLSYGTVPFGTPLGKVKLLPKTSSAIYVSLQGTTRDGISVINEYSVNDPMTVKVPAGWYVYVAWVGGVKYSGQFNLSGDGDRSIMFYDRKVTTQ